MIEFVSQGFQTAYNLPPFGIGNSKPIKFLPVNGLDHSNTRANLKAWPDLLLTLTIGCLSRQSPFQSRNCVINGHGLSATTGLGPAKVPKVFFSN